MRIQHNIMAMNAYRNYSGNTSALSKNLEKLSSGYKINRAGDDAAGLAISEKMRAQITGLKTAQKNAKDGISLVQTAEGALTEVHSMLNRMVELADQSANGTYDDDVDRKNLQKEFDALRTEIDRIADSSNFNGRTLLDGKLKIEEKVKNATVVNLSLPGATATAAAPSSGKVVLGKAGNAAVTAEFSVDLSGLNFTTNSTAVSSVMQISISGTNIAVTIAGDDDVTASDLANLFDTEVGSTGIQIGAFTYDVSVSGSQLVFTMQSSSVAAATGGSDLSVNFNVSVSLTTAGSGSLNSTNLNLGTEVIQAGVAKQDGVMAHTNFTLTSAMITDGARLTIGEETYVFKVGTDSNTKADANNGEKLVDLSELDPEAADFTELAVNALTRAAKDNAVFQVGQSNTTGEVTLAQRNTDKGTSYDMTTADKINDLIKMDKGDGSKTEEGGLTLQIGEDSQPFNQLRVGIEDMHVKALNIDASKININNQTSAQLAVDALKKAINTVSETRGGLGATQNRLEHTINNLSVMQENIQDAEANIRDVDVAEEMMAYTKNNILVQSAQAMLAQANQVPQGVLQLLQ